MTTGLGETGEILGRKVRVVGLVKGYSSLAGPYVFCSIQTSKPLFRLKPDQASYLLAKTHNPPADARSVVDRLREKYGDEMSAFTSEEFTWRSEMHWLTKTKAGVAMGVLSLLGLLVGAVVTGFTLYAATAASIREYAVLRALGIPLRMGMAVMSQSFWVGVLGVVVGLPTMYGLARAAEAVGNLRVSLAPWLLGSVAIITLAMALMSGLAALRILRQVEPANLLR